MRVRHASPDVAEPRRLLRGRRLKLLTLDEVAAHLDKPRSWVYGNWRRAEIPFRRIGNQLRCRPTDLEKWIDRQMP
ncbi:helix-turn-helix domain-containing protein [Streptomyces luteireticuli]|uniref:helix-turn-helix domain-containing protein n=1 Tax=Streptomyces luteireticuli TaxID=173858 RepID=UPI0035590EA0